MTSGKIVDLNCSYIDLSTHAQLYLEIPHSLQSLVFLENELPWYKLLSHPLWLGIVWQPANLHISNSGFFDLSSINLKYFAFFDFQIKLLKKRLFQGFEETFKQILELWIFFRSSEWSIE